MSSEVAAFYDVDGTIVRTNIVHAWAYYAANQATLGRSARKVLSTLAQVPLFWAADKVTRKGFNELFYLRYRGESEDRLRFLSEGLFEQVLKPAIFPGAEELIRSSRSRGIRQVLVTGALDVTIEALARHLGVDDVIANRLEFLDGYATGHLLPPVIAGATKVHALRDFCRREGIDLAECYAYSDSYSDYPMLAVVGRPAAVNPDTRLRLAARDFDWPILDLRS